MDPNMSFTILGSFISLLLMINAYFTRKTLEKLTELEVNLKENKMQHYYTERQAMVNADEIKKQGLEITKLELRVHSVEGGQKQVLQYFKDEGK